MNTITTLITGASSGIGKALAYECAEHGENLVLVARNIDALEAIRQSIHTQYPLLTITLIQKDLSQTWAAQDVFDMLQNQKISIQHLINNAWFGDYADFAIADWSKLENMITLNMTSLTHLTKLFLPMMQRGGYGRVMNVASTAAFQPGPGMAVYFATKAYVLSFSEAISEELIGTGVTVTALCPGPTESWFQSVSAMGESPMVKGRKLPTSEEVARYWYQALLSGKVVAIHGCGNWLFAQLNRVAPRWIVRKIVKKLQASK